MAQRRRACFAAHMVGTHERSDPLPGMQDNAEASPHKYSGSSQGNLGRVVVRFKKDERTEPLRKAIVGFAIAIQQSYRQARRLWLPRTDVTTKFPFFRDAFNDPGHAVMLDGSTQRMLAAREANKVQKPENLAVRRKPKFRTSEPGLRTIIVFNLAFVWWLMAGSM